MKTLLLVGPPGSGKTTLAGEIFRSGQLPGPVAYIFNDDGTQQTVDAGILAGFADFRPMTSGCFGCRDEGEFRKLVVDLKNGGFYSWLIIEPLGFVEGSEVPKVLSKCGITPHVIGLFDAANMELNDALGIVPSQLKAVTVGIGITKYDPSIQQCDDPALESVLDYIGLHAPGTKVFLTPRGGNLPDFILEGLADSSHHECHHGHEECGHAHHDHTHNHHHHDHDHGFHTYHFGLKDGVTFDTVRGFFNSNSQPIVRVKGVVSGLQFHRVHTTWEQTIPDPSPAFVTFYSTKPVDTAYFSDIIDAKNDRYAGKDTRAILRSGDVPVEKTITAIKQLLTQLPTQAIVVADGPVTHPEIVEMVNELRKRPNIPHELVSESIRRRVQYFLQVTAVLNPATPWWNAPGAAERKLNLAIGIGWFAYNKSSELGADIMLSILQVDLDTMLVEGLAELSQFNSDTHKALVFMGELADVIRFIGRPSNTLNYQLEQLAKMVSLDGRDELTGAWKDIFTTLSLTASL